MSEQSMRLKTAAARELAARIAVQAWTDTEGRQGHLRYNG